MAGPTHAQSGRSGRLYTHPVTGETAVSVTTILGDGVPKKALPGWAARETAQYAIDNMPELAKLVAKGGVDAKDAFDRMKGAPWRQRDNKADIGTAVHDVAERLALDGTEATFKKGQYDESIVGYLRGLYRFWQDWQPKVEAAESTVWSREWGYAGTYDLIATCGDYGRCLLDWKTSKGVYGETLLQLAAYAHADFILLDDGSEVALPGPEAFDHVGVVHLKPDGQYAAHLLPTGDLDPHWRAFLYAREIAYWGRELSVVPPPAPRPGVPIEEVPDSKKLKADWHAEASRLGVKVKGTDTKETIKAAVLKARAAKQPALAEA